MRRRVRDVMTQEVVTVDERASFKDVATLLAERRVTAVPVLDREGRVLGIVAEAARLLRRHGIKRMPVVDPAGPLLGIVSRADLLKVFLRSDADIAREIRQQVLARAMWMDPDTVTVEVRDGVVTLTGQLERRSLIPIAVSLAHGLDGVVDVVDRLTYELDDTPITVPSDLLFDRASTVRRRI
jgi:CBS-domain-containing membrane protein